MLPRLHVGVTVWPARSDFYYFLRHWVDGNAPQEAYRKLSLPPDLLATVSRLEYSPLWMLRWLFYRKAMRHLESEIAAIMRDARGKYRDVFFYLPDDGYWAELFHTIRERVGGPMHLLNIQHGHAALRKRSQTVRRLINKLCTMITGYPNFGYGFGAGTLDAYIVMSKKEGDFITENFGTRCYIAPNFVRGDFFAAAAAAAAAAAEVRPSSGVMRILFATNPVFGKLSNIVGARDKAETRFLRDIADCLRAIHAAVPCEIRLRAHPGQDRSAIEAGFWAYELDKFCKMDDTYGIVDSLMQCDFVLAYASTVLLEASLLGKVPVNFEPAAYPPREALSVRAEAITFKRAKDGKAEIETSRGDIPGLFNSAVMQSYATELPIPDYRSPLPWLEG